MKTVNTNSIIWNYYPWSGCTMWPAVSNAGNSLGPSFAFLIGKVIPFDLPFGLLCNICNLHHAGSHMSVLGLLHPWTCTLWARKNASCIISQFAIFFFASIRGCREGSGFSNCSWSWNKFGGKAWLHSPIILINLSFAARSDFPWKVSDKELEENHIIFVSIFPDYHFR